MFKNFNYNDAIQYAIKKNSNNSMNEQQKKINIIPTVMNSFDASLFVNICGLYYDTNHDADFGLLLSIYIQAIMPVKNSR